MPRRIVFPAKGRVELQQFELRAMGERDMRVRTIYSLMSIGTETAILHQKYAPGSHYNKSFSFPQFKTGVQAIAEVEATGSAVREFKIGDRIYMRMAHGSHQIMAEQDCSPVPMGVDLREGSWCGLAKTAWRAAWAGRFDQLRSLLVIGAGSGRSDGVALGGLLWRRRDCRQRSVRGKTGTCVTRWRERSPRRAD